MMENIIRGVAGAALQTAQLLGLPVVIKPHTTLNEKLNIHANVALADTEIPHARYLVIGNGGHRMVMGTNNISRPEPIQHLPRHFGLYNQLPFILRKPDNDLTVEERVNYRLRRVETHDGVSYVAYYLKCLDLSATIPQLEFRSVSDGNVYTTPFEPTIGDLNPTPPALTSTGVAVTTGDYIAATAKVAFNMSEWELLEFINVCTIIYGDANYAMISELGFCSGVDKTVTGDFNGVSIGYTDAIAVQIVSFLNVFYAAQFSNTGISILLDVGSVEPLLSLTSSS